MPIQSLFKRLIYQLVHIAAALPMLAMGATGPDLHAIQTSETLSLVEVIEQALQQDPRRGLPDEYRREATALQKRADSIISGTPALAIRHQTDEWGDDMGTREWEANLEFPLWRWGEQDASDVLAQRARAQAEHSSTALRLQIAGLVRDTLWDLVMAEERADLAGHAWQTALTLENEVKRRVAAGDLAKSDLLLAQDETLSRQDEHLLAAADRQHSIKRYLQLTGLQQRPAHFAETQSSKDTIDTAHPLMLEAAARMERAQAQLSQLQSVGSGNPQLTVGTRRERDIGTGTDMDSIGVGIRLPFGGGSHTAPGLAAAGTTLAQHTSEYAQLQRQLELSLHEAEHTVETLRMEQQLAAEQSRLASENLRMARIAFNLGETELAALLRVQNRAFAAERNLSLRQLQLQQAIARYNQAVGELP